MVLGDRAAYTWIQPWSRFSPGRLDWLLYDGSQATAARAFALDVPRLDDAARTAAGLERDDGAASDHLPLVLDLRPGRDVPRAAAHGSVGFVGRAEEQVQERAVLLGREHADVVVGLQAGHAARGEHLVAAEDQRQDTIRR